MRKSLAHIKTILAYIWRSSPGWTLGNALLILVRGVLPLLLLYLVKLLVDEIQALAMVEAGGRDFERLKVVLLASGGVFLINALSASISILVREKQSYAISDFFDRLIHHKLNRLEYGYFEHPNYQSVFYRALNEASYRPGRIFYGSLGVLQNLITLLLMAGVLVLVHWSVSLVLLLITLPVAFIRWRHARALFQFKKRNTRLEREVSYYNRLITAPDFVKEVRAFDLGSLFRSRYQNLKQEWRRKQFAMLQQKTLREGSVQVLAALAFVAVYGMIAWRAFEGSVSMGEVVLYFLALQRGYSYLQELLGRLAGLYEDSLFLDNLFEFMALRERQGDSRQEDGLHFPQPLRRGIRFENVGFHYPSNERWILRHLNFEIAAGETVALVGVNGTGKSTLIKLLNSLYEPVEGQILVDEVPLSRIAPTDRVANISVIFQDFILYNVSAAENIWFGAASEQPDPEKVRKAAREAGIDKVIEGFAQGYNTTLGTLFEGSEQMSPGQWQRLALARSFYNDAQLILLDEPTSSLDAFSEARLLRYIRSITRGRTALIVSHRLSTIKMADRLVVLEGEGVVETGSFDDLSKKENGHFKRMLSSLSDAMEA